MTQSSVWEGAFEAHAPRRRRAVLSSRPLDIGVALLALVFMAPLMTAIGLLIWGHDRGPIFYAQTRIGRGGRRFRCYKFRSMVLDADVRLKALLDSNATARREWHDDHKLRQDPRITGVGGFLRKSSLDELPQLLNVLRGDMALVGPRPITDVEAVRYGRRYKSYCSVRPGITGLWQVSGRNNVSYRRRVALDTLYARSKCLVLDISILARTIPAVLSRDGSY